MLADFFLRKMFAVVETAYKKFQGVLLLSNCVAQEAKRFPSPKPDSDAKRSYFHFLAFMTIECNIRCWSKTTANVTFDKGQAHLDVLLFKKKISNQTSDSLISK